MINNLKETLRNQFGAGIDMLKKKTLLLCPPEYWDTRDKFWYKAYHTLFFLDYYLTYVPKGFLPPAPFSLLEMDLSGILPERVYEKAELLNYLKFCRKKCRVFISELNEETAQKRWINSYRDYDRVEILIDNHRHV